jgi:hypothetical protein
MSTIDRPEAGELRPMSEAQRRHDARRLREGLDSLARIGTEVERRETSEQLMAALEATRREEGRPF